MARYQFLCLFVVAALGTRPCCSQQSMRDGEVTPPNLLKEVEDNSRYKTLEANATLLKLLVDDKDGVSKSEVFDMLHSKDDVREHLMLPTFPEDAEEGRVDVPVVPDSQAEFLQEEPMSNDLSPQRYSGVHVEPIGLAAGIMVAVTIGIVVLAYTAFFLWRRIYIKKNGLKHELLRNEEIVAETRIEL